MKTKHTNEYFAGLIDGEAWIGLQKRRNSLRQTITVSMTCHATIEALKLHFNCGQMRAAKLRPNRKQIWEWRAQYYDAISVIEKVRPFLITKAADADKVLSYEPKKRGRPQTKRAPN